MEKQKEYETLELVLHTIIKFKICLGRSESTAILLLAIILCAASCSSPGCRTHHSNSSQNIPLTSVVRI